MKIEDISLNDKHAFNAVVHHPLQTFEWGSFREKTGVKVIRRGFYENDILQNGYEMSIHKIPKTPFNIGYIPKENPPTKGMLEDAQKIGVKEKCIFIQLEPNIERNDKDRFSRISKDFSLKPAAHPLFTKYDFILDLTPSEEELLKNMHPKTRYNIRVAQKHGVEIVEDNSETAFETFWKLTEETTKRQKFYAHTKNYHRLQWQTLSIARDKNNDLTSHMFFSKYQNKILAAWILFTFQDTLYYPYGSSTNEHREVMASNLMMWEVIRFGKSKGLKKFDMWGAMSDTPDTKDPWYGFHRFKQGYGARHVEFIGSFDLVINPALYQIYKIADKTRWTLLKLRK